MRGELLIGLGLGLGLGFAVGYLYTRWRQAEAPTPTAPPISTGVLTTIARDERGYIIDVLEKNIYGPVVG